MMQKRNRSIQRHPREKVLLMDGLIDLLKYLRFQESLKLCLLWALNYGESFSQVALEILSYSSSYSTFIGGSTLGFV